MMTNKNFIKALVASVAISEVEAHKMRRPRPRPRPKPKPCAGLPTSADGTVDPSVILDWRILLTPAAAGLGLGKCGGCVVKNLGKFNDAGAVIEAFGKCGSPAFPTGDLPTAANGALSFVPPQNPAACKDGPDAEGCQECIDNTLAWSIPAAADSAFVGPNAYGANKFDIDDAPESYAFKTVNGGCSATEDGCTDDDKAKAAELCGTPTPGPCAGLPADDEGDLDPSTVLNWRILFNTDVAASLGAEECLGCVVKNLDGKFNDAGATVAAFAACDAPPIDATKLPTMSIPNADASKDASTVNFAPPQNPGACGAFPSSDPANWVDFCTGADAEKNGDCCQCAINSLNWAAPAATGDNITAVGGNTLGANTYKDSNGKDVSGGCGFGTGNCTFQDAQAAFEGCGSDAWDTSKNTEDFPTP